MSATTSSLAAPGSSERGPSETAVPDVHSYADARVLRRALVIPIVITTALLIVAAFADVILAIPAFNGVLGESPVLSLFCGIAFVSIAIGAAVNAGRELKHGNRFAVYAAGLAVLLLVGGLLVLRITAAGINTSAAVFEGSTPTEDGALAEIPVAIVFAALMIATSILAAIDGYLLTVSRQVKNLRVLTRSQQRNAAQIASTEAELTRHVENLGMAEGRIRHLDRDLEEAIEGLQSFARELQEIARTEIARHLGSPTATSGLDVPIALPATTTH